MINSFYPLFKIDTLSGFIALAVGLFFILTLAYSSKFMKGRPRLIEYYAYIILTALAAVGVVFTNDLLLLLVFWGFLGFTLYALINFGGDNASPVAKKTFIIVGGSDALMLLGIAIIYHLAATMQMDRIKLELNNPLAVTAYLCLAVGCFAKAGAMPFHSWIPECAQEAPVPVVAYLPASLDKLLGIYLLARISLDLFVMNQAMNLLLMVVGAVTIIAAVMMALVQHNMKKLLGYCAVSQVGYMVLGIGTGIPIGIAGGIFHMLNHAIYKSCLFFNAGNVEYRTKTTELDELGGLSRFMPLTYISTLIASLSISGVPPFNGFVSKWMIYQGLVERMGSGGANGVNFVVILCLAAAMFGSALTLASFMKLLHGVFLGGSSINQQQKPKEAPWQMWFPCIVLAALCILFGVFARSLPLKYFILPAVGGFTSIGSWPAGICTLMVIAGLVLGLIVFRLKGLRPVLRADTGFTGAETIDLPPGRVSGTEFYNTVKELEPLKYIYRKAAAGSFDIYEQLKSFVFGIGRFLQYLHNGILPTYLVWTLLGMIVLFFILVK